MDDSLSDYGHPVQPTKILLMPAIAARSGHDGLLILIGAGMMTLIYRKGTGFKCGTADVSRFTGEK
ncbi:hypothetical protein ACN6KF_005768 [Labrys sp. La1]|uniref:hypothetical protein n=1 Tax=Labrys sp. La1 TaxID=3404917 RepID=UPI003EB8BE65